MGLFFGGVPTKMDVDKLVDKFKMQPGTQVSYTDVGETIGCKITSNRFKTVTNAWRRRLFNDFGTRIVAEGGMFRALTADEAHDYGRSDLRRAGRAAKRAVLNVEAVDETGLSAEKKQIHGLVRREARAILEQHRLSAKTIAAPKPITETHLRLAK